MAWAYENDVPVTPWGAGTSTEGNPVPTRGGLVVDLTRMNRILEIRPQDLQADVEPGVLRKELNRQAGQHGLFFPPDPGADATIGGMIANNASGVQTVKYGATKDYVMRLTVVLPGRPGHPHRLQGAQVLRRLRPDAAFRRLRGDDRDRDRGHPAADRDPQPLPGRHHPLSGPGKGLRSRGVDDRLRPGPCGPRASAARPDRLMNRKRTRAGGGAFALLRVPCDQRNALQETAHLAKELCEECGATGFQYATEEADRKELWRARHEAWETIHRAHPKQETLIVDAAVPISRYPEMVVFAQQAVDAHQAIGYVFGHAGDGNLHVVMAGDPANRTEWGKLEAINQAIVEKAIQVGGTCTGEHGVGIGKRKFMQMEHGESFELMRQIKNLDRPQGAHEPGENLLRGERKERQGFR